MVANLFFGLTPEIFRIEGRVTYHWTKKTQKNKKTSADQAGQKCHKWFWLGFFWHSFLLVHARLWFEFWASFCSIICWSLEYNFDSSDSLLVSSIRPSSSTSSIFPFFTICGVMSSPPLSHVNPSDNLTSTMFGNLRPKPSYFYEKLLPESCLEFWDYEWPMRNELTPSFIGSIPNSKDGGITCTHTKHV